jgi:hypothetical protein
MFVLILTTNLYGLTLSPIPPSTIQVYSPAPQNIPCFRSKDSMLYSHDKGKVIPTQARTGPGGSRRVRFPDFKTIGT